MMFTPEQAKIVMKITQDFMARVDLSEAEKLQEIFRHISIYRAAIMAGMTLATIGPTVYSGPFKGMKLDAKILTGLYAPHLLGIYEHELHPTIEQAASTPYQRILNIGCSIGYYAVGLARRLPNAHVDAFDIDPQARIHCADLAALNDVQDRITIGEEFKGADFARYENLKTLLVMDIEGAEETLLDPAAFPAIRKMDVIVELHEVMKKGLAEIIMQRFRDTHDLMLIANKPMMFDLGQIIGQYAYIDPFDIYTLGWENRAGPTPWGVFRAKA